METDTEISAIMESLKFGIPVTAVLDHWGNYLQDLLKITRFIYQMKFNNYAYVQAKKEFSNTKISLKNDDYAKTFSKKY